MPVTILNKLPNLVERDEMNLAVEEMLDSSEIAWNVSIQPSAKSGALEVRAYALNQTFSTMLSGRDGTKGAVLKEFIRDARSAIERAQKSGANVNWKDALLEEFKLLSGSSPGIESWITPETDEQVFVRLPDRLET
jgi:hypothetical protein